MREQIFRRIYRMNRWKGPETPSGPGSTLEATSRLLDFIPDVMRVLGATSVLDAGCGPGLWVPELPGYVGVDIVPEAVEAAQEAAPWREYLVADVVEDDLPRCDLVMTRDVFQHLPLRDGLAALANFRRSGAVWLLASTHADGTNKNVPAGRWYAVNLEEPPFSLGSPLLETDDGFWDKGVVWPTKRFGVWAL